jgi:hypothetical protein
MRIKMKWLFILLSFLLLTVFVSADDSLYVPELSTAPEIDGDMDEVYGTEIDISVEDTTVTPPFGYDDLSPVFQVGWNGDSLYFFINILDDIIDTDAAEEWQNDGCEFYFDGDYSRDEFFDGENDIHLTIEADTITGDVIPVDSEVWDGQACNYKIVLDDDGWYLEIAFDLEDAYLPDPVESAGVPWGFECQVNDADGGNRDHIIRWHSPDNNVWLNPGLWGTAFFIVPTRIIDLPDAPTIKDFTLEQNYPNPFNPATKIQYIIHTPGKVNLTVYDVLGKEVVTLVDEVQVQGAHTAEFNGTGYSSGVYYYQLKSGSTVETRKMILMK